MSTLEKAQREYRKAMAYASAEARELQLYNLHPSEIVDKVLSIYRQRLSRAHYEVNEIGKAASKRKAAKSKRQ